jgi:hypothetical protein
LRVEIDLWGRRGRCTRRGRLKIEIHRIALFKIMLLL